MTTVKSFVAPIVAVVFGIGTVGTALAQATSTAPAQAPASAPATTPPPATTPAPAQKPAESKQKPTEAKAKKAHGMVKSASADSVVVAGKEKVQGSKEMKDAEWTFAVDSKTAIRKSGKAVTSADLKAGDQVEVRYMDHSGKMTAVAIQIKPTTAAAKPTEKK
jgi:Domain of unknown function (DUF5666)